MLRIRSEDSFGKSHEVLFTRLLALLSTILGKIPSLNILRRSSEELLIFPGQI